MNRPDPTSAILSPPTAGARAALVDLVGRDLTAAGHGPLDRANANARIAEWITEILNTYDGVGVMQRRLGQPDHVDFNSQVALHQQHGFAEVYRWTITDIGFEGKKTSPPCALMLHPDLGILAWLRGYWSRQHKEFRPLETTWWLNALVTDANLFRVAGGGRDTPGLLLSPGETIRSIAHSDASYDQLIGDRDSVITGPRQLHVGPLSVPDAGIGDRLTILRASSVPLAPWVFPAMGPGSLQGNVTYSRADDDPRTGAEERQHNVENTAAVLSALPAEVYSILGNQLTYAVAVQAIPGSAS